MPPAGLYTIGGASGGGGVLRQRAASPQASIGISLMRLALFQPDIPQNAGALMRLAACLGVAVDLIAPCGFLLDDRRLRRAGMDYLDALDLVRHRSWQAYRQARADRGGDGRLLLLTTRGDIPYTAFAYRPQDTVLVGRESGGAPPEVHAAADARLVIPMRPGLRSLNVALAASMVLGEALRQCRDGPGRAGPEEDVCANEP
jgi:tRNA (cytidine/uridine-2'-O-)-methyltransferase